MHGRTVAGGTSPAVRHCFADCTVTVPPASMAMHCAAGANDTPKEFGSLVSATHGLEHALQGPLALQNREGHTAATQGAVDDGWEDAGHQSLGMMNFVAVEEGPLATHQTSRVMNPTLL